MEYNEFLDYLLSQLEAEFDGYASVSCHKILKNNNVYFDAFTVCTNKSNISSTVYINDYFLEYKNGKSISNILDEITGTFKKSCLQDINTGFINDFLQVQSQIAVKLINFEANAELLSDIPYKSFLDLAAVFYIIVKQVPFNNASILIQNYHLELWNINTDELYSIAFNNTLSLLGYEIKNMNTIIRELLVEDLKQHLYSEYQQNTAFCDSDGLNKFADDIISNFHNCSSDRPMFVLTNKERFLGASCILYLNILEKFALIHQSDIFILPSSIHEVILIPVSESPSREELRSMVREINQTEVADTERLSDNVYLYSLSDKKIYL